MIWRDGRALAMSAIAAMGDMTDFDLAINYVLENEGGVVDDPNDPGGLTNFGISQKQYPDLDIRDLTRDQAEQRA